MHPPKIFYRSIGFDIESSLLAQTEAACPPYSPGVWGPGAFFFNWIACSTRIEMRQMISTSFLSSNLDDSVCERDVMLSIWFELKQITSDKLSTVRCNLK